MQINLLAQDCDGLSICKRLRGGHPDPGPIVNVQVWDLAASAFWRFFGLFIFDSTFLRRCGHSQTLPFSEMAKEDAARFFK